MQHLITAHQFRHFTCSFCDFECIERNTLDDHMMNVHQMLAVLNGLAGNQKYVSESFDKFKEEVINVLNKLSEDNIVIKQELFILRQLNKVNPIQPTPQKTSANHFTIPPQSQSNPSPPTAFQSNSSSAAPKSNTPPKPAFKPTIPPPKGKTMNASQAQSRTSNGKTVLFIGDSISGNVDIDVIEKALNAKVKTSKAYASIFDNVGSKAKQPARFPTKNFTDVIPIEVKKEPFDYLLLQAGSVDITNLDTKVTPEEHSTYFKQEVRFAAKNLFNAAEAALIAQPNLKKVIIFNLTPRYDLPAVDPLSLKSALAQLFNNTLVELWIDSPLKDKVAVGLHNLECGGGIKEARYRDIRNCRYDGVHLYGPSGRKAYTISVIDILKAADILDQTQGEIVSGQVFYSKLVSFQYQQKRRPIVYSHRDSAKVDSENDRDIRKQRYNKGKDTYGPRYSVPTSNMFDNLNY